MPSPLQDSHRPPFTLKLKRPFLYPRIFASFVVANKSRISSNTPVYVAGLLRGVLPIGLWSISIILSRLSNPEMLLNFPGFSFVRVISRAKAFFNTLLTSELFPEPDTPVTATKRPRGTSTSIPRKLFSAAPSKWIQPLSSLRRSLGTGIYFLPAKYCPVSDFLFFSTSFGVPAAIISPPNSPAPGPISIK